MTAALHRLSHAVEAVEQAPEPDHRQIAALRRALHDFTAYVARREFIRESAAAERLATDYLVQRARRLLQRTRP